MRDWQLELQQEGDDCALPVETHEIEILEGRYRLLIRQLPTDQRLTYRIVYRNPQEPGQPRRVHEAEQHSDSQGQLEVFPFTYLRPGIWDLEWPESPEARLRLQVLARDADDDLSQPAATPEPSVTADTPLTSPPTPTPEPQFRILLRQSRFWVQPGELLTLSGELQLLGNPSPPPDLRQAELAIDLRRGNDWQCSHTSALNPPSFPWTFSLPVSVPVQADGGSLAGQVRFQWGDRQLTEAIELNLFQPPLPRPEPEPATVTPPAPTLSAPSESASSELEEPSSLTVPDQPLPAVAAEAPQVETETSGPAISFTLIQPGSTGSAPRSPDLPFATPGTPILPAAIPAAVPFPEPPPTPPAPPVPAPPFLERLHSMIEQALPAPAAPKAPQDEATDGSNSVSETPNLTPQPAAPEAAENTVPAPRLTCQGPVLSGGDLSVQVSLPRSGIRRVVKLWLQDNRQNRRLGQLRLVADFSDGDSEQAIAHLSVSLPDDLNDLSLEAVTIELPSQRESPPIHLPLG